MGFFDFLKPNKKRKDKEIYRASAQKSIYPSFTQFGDDIMNDDLVFTIVNRILEEYSKLNPRHERMVKGIQNPVTRNDINEVLAFPNSLMNKTDFLRKIAYLRETYDNVFIYPVYDLYINPQTKQEKKVYKELIPLEIRKVDFYQDAEGTYLVEFTWMNGKTSELIPYDEVIHWRKNYGQNEFMGGNQDGIPNNSALLKYLQLNDKLLQSTFKTVEGSLIINGVLKYGGIINKDDREKQRKKFIEDLKSNEAGIIALDSGGEYIPIPFNGKTIEKETLEFYRNNIREHYGVSGAILSGDYSNEQKESFYETVIEAGAISLGEAFTRVLLTPGERSNGNRIVFYTHRIQMMNADKKIQLANLLMPVGGVSPNQVLSWFGEPPYDGGDERYISLNWIKASDASKYQVGDDASNNKKNNTDENEDNNAEKNKGGVTDE